MNEVEVTGARVMRLAPGEERVLAEIEARLRWSDPRLAAKLVLFGHRPGRGPTSELVSPWGRRRRQAIRILVLSAVIVMTVVGTAVAMRSGRAGRSDLVACRARPSATSIWPPSFCRLAPCQGRSRASLYPQFPSTGAGPTDCRQPVAPARAAGGR